MRMFFAVLAAALTAPIAFGAGFAAESTLARTEPAPMLGIDKEVESRGYRIYSEVEHNLVFVVTSGPYKGDTYPASAGLSPNAPPGRFLSADCINRTPLGIQPQDAKTVVIVCHNTPMTRPEVEAELSAPKPSGGRPEVA